ncbi:MAG: transposase [Desulfovibrio sp.]|nr:transposase [Desulfovibrio sp.]
MFLEEMRKQRHPDGYIVMFMDQAGWHRAQKLRIPQAMELVFLPPYSPDLNPQEQIWDELREKFFSNRLFKSLRAVIETADIGLRKLESMSALIKSLSHRNWILNAF